MYVFFYFFSAEEHESMEDRTSQISSHNKQILPGLFPHTMIFQSPQTHPYCIFVSLCVPEFVLCLDASDGFLKDRVMNLPERLVQEHNYEQERFLRRLSRYRENNVGEETVVNCLDELDISPLCLGKPSCCWGTYSREELYAAFILLPIIHVLYILLP